MSAESVSSVRRDGFVAPGFEGVAEAFARNVGVGGEAGGAFAAVLDGELVVDVWGGVADRARGVAWSGDTLSMVFSGTKGLVATCMLLLVERGKLDLDAPVAQYWPEFAAHGKDAILVRHVLSHQAGMPGVVTPVTSEEARDDGRMARLLAAQAPIAPPGAIVTYHVLTYGWLCGELVRRVDGRSIGRFLREEVAEPLGLDVWIGLPEAQESRVAVLEQTAGFGTEEEAPPPAGGQDALSERERILWSIDNPSGSLAVANSRAERAAEVPAANGLATARALARLYGCLARGGEIDGVRLLRPATAALAGRCIARGHDPYHDRPIAYAAGFHLNPDGGLGPRDDAYGHCGAGGSTHGCWPGLRTGFSFTTNLLDGPVKPRGPALLAALHDAVRAT